MSRTRFRSVSAGVAPGLMGACSGSEPQLPERIVDLSPTIAEDLPVRIWGHKLLSDFNFRDSTRFERIEFEQPTYVQDSYYELFSHGGAHLDAARHLAKDGSGVDEYELHQLLGPARVLDFRQAPTDQPIGRAEVENLGIRAGDIVLVLVGYSAPAAADELPSYAYISPEAAEYLAQIPVKAVGTDAWGVENPKRIYELMAAKASGYETLVPTHHAFLSRGIPVFEELENLDTLLSERDVICRLPTEDTKRRRVTRTRCCVDLLAKPFHARCSMRGIAFPMILATVAVVGTGCEPQPTEVTAAESLRFAQGTPKLKVDQSNTVSDQLGLGNGLYGQTFVPGANNLAVVDIVAIINNVPAPGVESTLGLFTDITQPPIATTTTFVPVPAPGELERTIRFVFDPAVPLVKGASYTIGLYAPADVSWEFAFGDPYPQGQVVLYDGTPLNPTADFVFITYASKK